MAATSYYNAYIPATHEQQQHLLAHPSPLGDHFSQPPTPLESLHSATETSYHHHNNTHLEKPNDLQHTSHDAALKSRIRHLRLLSRLLSLALSIAVLTPITMTLIKFLQTKSTYHTPPGSTTPRTAWPHTPRVWPTYTYFGVALVSTLLDAATLASYAFGVHRANTAATVASVFGALDVLGNVVVWGVAAGMYRAEKDRHGKSDDLWGWTCSRAARVLQGEFEREVDFDRYCGVQSVSWGVGVGRVAAAVLGLAVWVLVCRRRKGRRGEGVATGGRV